MQVTRVHIALFLLVLAAAFIPRACFVLRTSPYPLQEDEALIAVPAARMLDQGHLNPHFFKYPSLPIYLTAGGFALGRLLDGDSQQSIGCVGRPYYSSPRVVVTARLLFNLLSVATFALMGFLAWRAFRDPLLLVIAPLLLLASDRYLLQSWMYLNVDIVGAFVCTAAVTLVFLTRDRGSLFQRAILPGLITGFAVSSKYYLGLVGLPFALLLFEGRHRPKLARNLSVIVLATLVGFAITTPYALIDRQTFVEQVVFEIDHYQVGHDRGEGEPGFSQLAYYAGQMKREFGWGILVLALLGVGSMLKRDRFTALLFLAFPTVLLVFLSAQRVHFPRNLTSFYALLPVAAALGVGTLSRGLTSLLSKGGRRSPTWLAPSLVLLALIPSLPLKRMQASYGVPLDSRTRAIEWIQAQRPTGTRVYVAEELQMDLSDLAAFDVVEAPIPELVRADMNRFYADENPVFVLPEIIPGTRFARTFEAPMKPVQHLALRARFGRNLLPRLTSRLVHMGDPRLQVLELNESGAK